MTWVLPEMSLSVACATFACRSRDRGATPRIPTPLSPACCCAFHQTFNRPRIARHVFMGLDKLHHLARPSYFGRPSLTDSQNSIDTRYCYGCSNYGRKCWNVVFLTSIYTYYSVLILLSAPFYENISDYTCFWQFKITKIVFGQPCPFKSRKLKCGYILKCCINGQILRCVRKSFP